MIDKQSKVYSTSNIRVTQKSSTFRLHQFWILFALKAGGWLMGPDCLLNESPPMYGAKYGQTDSALTHVSAGHTPVIWLYEGTCFKAQQTKVRVCESIYRISANLLSDLHRPPYNVLLCPPKGICMTWLPPIGSTTTGRCNISHRCPIR